MTSCRGGSSKGSASGGGTAAAPGQVGGAGRPGGLRPHQRARGGARCPGSRRRLAAPFASLQAPEPNSRVQLLRLTSHHACLSLLCPLAAQAPRLWCLELPGLVLLQGRASFVCVSVCAPVSLSVCLPACAVSCACCSSGASTALPTSLAGDVRRQDRVKRRSNVPSGTGRQLPQRRACLLPACRRASMPACLPTPLPMH